MKVITGEWERGMAIFTTRHDATRWACIQGTVAVKDRNGGLASGIWHLASWNI
jgi:hypothetical protein